MNLSDYIATGLAAQRDDRDHRILSASSSGACARQRTYRLRGDPDEEAIGPEGLLVFAFGHAIEALVVEALAAGGCAVVDAQREVRVPLPGGGEVVGHIDGLLSTDPPTLFECKSISEFGFKVLDGPKPEHVAQCLVYLHGLRAQGVGCESARIVYVNKGAAKGKAWSREYDIDYDADAVAAILAEWAGIRDHDAAGTLPFRPDGYSMKFWACRYCGHAKKCYGDEQEVVT